MEILLAFIGGLVFAALVAFFIARGIVKSRVAQTGEAVRIQVESGYKVDMARLNSEMGHAEEQIARLQGQLDEAKADTARQVKEAKEDAAKRYSEDLEARENAHQKAMEELDKRFQVAMDRLKSEVEVKTGQMLKDRQEEFSKKSNQDIEQILNPLKERIAELKGEMEKGNKEQIDLKAQMRAQVEAMLKHSDAASKSADNLAAAFMFGSKMQGDWGETILTELLSSQGLTKGVNFDTQYTIRDDKGAALKSEEGKKMIPDVILHLGNDRDVIIDSKVSLKAYVDFVNAGTDEDKKKFLKEHIDSIKKHVKELSNKDYSSYIQPPKVSSGFVMMFVPNAGALWAALRAEPSLWRWAADMNVYIADEQSLYGALRIVDLTWMQIKQAQNHKEVFELADEMIKRVGDYVVRYNAIGESLKKVAEAYRSASIKLSPEGQGIITTAARLINLGADSKQLIKVNSSKKEQLGKILDINITPMLDSSINGAEEQEAESEQL